jgi:hypothetical protein
MGTADDTFLSRWSRRKAQVRVAAVPPEPASDGAALAVPTPVAPVAPVAVSVEGSAAASPAGEPPPTLEDVARLTGDSHYGRFVQPDVDPAVKNAALKRLFTEPQFNVMDGLDTYIDDYGKPDPLPVGMLRQMAQARFLGLFTDEEGEDESAAAARPPDPSVVAASDFEAPVPEPLPNEDTDLRLQPDDAPGCAGTEPGAGPHAGRER